MNIIYSGIYSPGERLKITNPNSVAATYRIDYGTAGAVILTIPPGGEFTVVVGITAPDINLEHVSSAGIRPA